MEKWGYPSDFAEHEWCKAAVKHTGFPWGSKQSNDAVAECAARSTKDLIVVGFAVMNPRVQLEMMKVLCSAKDDISGLQTWRAVATTDIADTAESVRKLKISVEEQATAFTQQSEAQAAAFEKRIEMMMEIANASSEACKRVGLENAVLRRTLVRRGLPVPKVPRGPAPTPSKKDLKAES